jgi:hypothetical protein
MVEFRAMTRLGVVVWHEMREIEAYHRAVGRYFRARAYRLSIGADAGDDRLVTGYRGGRCLGELRLDLLEHEADGRSSVQITAGHVKFLSHHLFAAVANCMFWCPHGYWMPCH